MEPLILDQIFRRDDRNKVPAREAGQIPEFEFGFDCVFELCEH
jgi:hypothetical protein